jgi:hypothetical protein
MNFLKTISAAIVGISLAAATTQATIIVPNSVGVVPSAELAPPGGGTLLGSLSATFANGAQIGTLMSWVYSGYSGNTLGGLTFVYQVTEGNGDHIATLGLNGFLAAAPIADVGFVVGTGVAPTLADWTLNTFNFHFAPNVMSGQSSDLLIVNTANPQWGQSTANVIDGDIASTFDLAPVPEPTTMIAGALLLLPFGASTLRILRRNRTA